MIAELVYLPTLLLIGLGILLLGDSGSSDDPATDEVDPVDEGTLGVGEDAPTDPEPEPEEPPTVTTQLDDESSTFEGGPSDDVVFAGDADDTVSGGGGNDRVFLNDGDDVSTSIAGNAEGDDLIRGGDGNDIIADEVGANTIFGDLGADTISTLDTDAETTPDTAHGGFGNDVMFADSGDVVTGGGGNDTFNLPISTGTEDPVIITDYEDGEGLIVELPDTLINDTASAELSASGLDTEIKVGDQIIAVLQGYTNVDAVDAQFVLRPATDDVGIVVAANDAAQTIAGTEFADEITTGAGNDVVNAGGGDDAIDASEGGNNIVNAGTGDDVAVGGDGDDTMNGSLGADVLTGGAGSDELNGGFGADVLTAVDAAGTDAADTLLGGAGADTLIGDDGDIMTGGDYTDTFVVQSIEADDAVVVVTDFDVSEDQLEIGADGALTYVAANDGVDTTVLVDGIAVFLLQGVTPAEMADATVTVAAAA